MATLNDNAACCGIKEIDGIMGYKPETIFKDIAHTWFDNDYGYAYIFFSTTSPSKSGHNLATYITKHKLGTITKMRPVKNGNTENMLTMWVWTVNKKNFKAYCIRNKFVSPEEEW